LPPCGLRVKPAHILLASDPPEYAYLTDFSVAEVPGAADTAITRPGQRDGSEPADRFATASDLAFAATAAEAD
jgi:hypothetical protein